MNIFFLDHHPIKAARMHCDKHVVKMILESAQMLCTAHRVLDGNNLILEDKELNSVLYKATHINHPCSKWIREGSMNYTWLYCLFEELCYEYTFRYGKIHKCQKLFIPLLCEHPKNLKFDMVFTEVVQAMPEEYKELFNPVKAYRNYYLNAKKDILKYTNREYPDWILNENE